MVNSNAATLKTLENQIGQIANALMSRPPGALPSDTEPNPGKREGKEQVQAITLRSGKTMGQPGKVTEQAVETEPEKEPENEPRTEGSGAGALVGAPKPSAKW